MTCPHCRSDQITQCTLRSGVVYLECVNCDFEGLVAEETLEDLAANGIGIRQAVRP